MVSDWFSVGSCLVDGLQPPPAPAPWFQVQRFGCRQGSHESAAGSAGASAPTGAPELPVAAQKSQQLAANAGHAGESGRSQGIGGREEPTIPKKHAKEPVCSLIML